MCNVSATQNYNIEIAGSAADGGSALTPFTITSYLATNAAGYILQASWHNTGANPIVSFTASWVVPSNPPQIGGELDIWIGLINSNANPYPNNALVIQPVMFWYNGAWGIYSVFSNATTVLSASSAFTVQPGATVTAQIKCTAVSGGSYTYTCQFVGYSGTLLTVGNQPMYQYAYVVLENPGGAPAITSCGMYPPGSTAVSSIAISTGTPGTVGTSASPTWTAVANYTDCGLAMGVTSSKVTFVY